MHFISVKSSTVKKTDDSSKMRSVEPKKGNENIFNDRNTCSVIRTDLEINVMGL